MILTIESEKIEQESNYEPTGGIYTVLKKTELKEIKPKPIEVRVKPTPRVIQEVIDTENQLWLGYEPFEGIEL